MEEARRTGRSWVLSKSVDIEWTRSALAENKMPVSDSRSKEVEGGGAGWDGAAGADEQSGPEHGRPRGGAFCLAGFGVAAGMA